MKRTAKEIQNLSNVKALKSARAILALTRKELAARLNNTVKAVEKYENGRDQLSEERLLKIIDALGITMEQFKKIKKGKSIKSRERTKKVLSNSDRRSYQKNITKECQVLKSMRRIKGISQDMASKLCGYSRPTIGHIENGRIELTIERIKHIISSYGYQFDDFEENMQKDELRDQIIDACIKEINRLDDTKLIIAKALLKGL